MRALAAPEQQALARQGELAERVAVERICGRLVWDCLLANPRLTAPEVARLSRLGTLPRPLVDTIVANEGWLSSAEVRRALLSNPRVRGRALDRVLRGMGRAELLLLPSQTAFRTEVRTAARRLLGE